MNYQRFAFGVERRRMLLRQKLEQANTLRREAHLPLRDVDQEVTEQEPLLTQEQHDAQAEAHAGFKRFRRKQLSHIKHSHPVSTDTWDVRRAMLFRRAFLEYGIKQAWLLENATCRN